MNKKIINVLVFVAGAAVGSVATGIILKQKYEKILEEEIDYINKKSHSENETSTEEIKPLEDDKELEKVETLVEDLGYAQPEEINEGECGTNKDIYVISPYVVGDQDDFDVVSLTYYSDGSLAYDSNELVEDVESLVGAKSLQHFGEYEDDSVYVRNEKLKTDFEILRDSRKYSEIIQKDTNPAYNN